MAPATPLAVVDPAGNVVLANGEAAVLLGTPADTPAYAPTHRWTPQVPVLRQLTLRVLACARQDPGWSGSTRVHVPFLDAPMSVTARPVFDGTQVIGALLVFGPADGPFEISRDDADLHSPGPRSVPYRVVALRDDRWVLLDPREIRFAEADHGNVWLASDQGRLLAAARGLDHLDLQLGDKGFLRVHRRFLVNLSRVREIELGFKGALLLATDTRSHESVPVARRHVPQVRQALGL
jgi:hypothetical protein